MVTLFSTGFEGGASGATITTCHGDATGHRPPPTHGRALHA